MTTVTPGNRTLVYTLGSRSEDPTKCSILVVVADCLGAAVSGATVSSDAAATAFYYPQSAATSTASSGLGMFLNAATGTATVSANRTGASFRSHTVACTAGHFAETVIAP